MLYDMKKLVNNPTMEGVVLLTKLYEEVGWIIKKHRKERNYSTSDLAARLGVSHGWVNNLENAKTDIFKLELLKKLTQELKIPIEELLRIDAVDEKRIAVTNRGELEIIIKMLEEQNQSVDILVDKLKKINKEYINFIMKHRCNKRAIEIVSEHILQQLKLIEKIEDMSKGS